MSDYNVFFKNEMIDDNFCNLYENVYLHTGCNINFCWNNHLAYNGKIIVNSNSYIHD
jgi:hypothetical protein